MASSRLNDDTCAYQRALKQSVDPLAYQLEPAKYIHGRRCRMTLGIVGGNTVSTLNGEALVDTESELFNITRPASLCPLKKYVPGRDYVRPDKTHLQSCQMINYKGTPGAMWTPPGPVA
jgi:hypothetical protein